MFNVSPPWGVNPQSAELIQSAETSKIKILTYTLAIVEKLKDSSFPKEQAQKALIDAGYDIGDGDLTRKLNKNTGEGFWDKTIGIRRMVCYGPGEYVQPHFHNIHETFEIMAGGCHVWISQTNGESWEYHYCSKGEKLHIPEKAWHCLVAGKEGLCMHVDNDSQRTIDWLDTQESKMWSPTLDFTGKVSIQDLRKATNLVIKQ